MSDLPPLRTPEELAHWRNEHLASGLLDETLLTRYSHVPDLVAFIDETHPSTDGGEVTYYGLSAVIFHADNLPEIRKELEAISGRGYWHAKDEFRRPGQKRKDDIERMAAYINEKAAKPIVVFDLKKGELSEGADERKMRDYVLRSMLKHLNDEGIRDVVLDTFPKALSHNVEADKAILTRLQWDGSVDADMWIHHAQMRKEHALWAADTVVWAAQRSELGKREGDSRFIAPLAPNLHHMQARTGLKVPPVVQPEAVREANQKRRPPIFDMPTRIRQAREAKEKLEKARRDSAVKRGVNTQSPARPITPPTTRREGPTQSR
ncbi:hypothetical protein KRX56_01670 [Dermabacteraceae bacterium TAE3-ERU27]|nr:hypothetical protein [Dermabacteraceae bacterium TAE3-ERU27]